MNSRGSHEDDRQQLWQEVDKAMNEGLPRTAIEKLDAIHEGAVADKAWPEAIRAKARRILLDGQINQPPLPLMIKEWTAAIDAAPEEMKPVMRVILAEWFFGYYQENRWRFMQRSQTEVPPGDDIETWDLARLLGEIDKRFTEALEASESLKQIPVADYDMLLTKGSVSDAHRPTLYDFVAYEALSFYALDEQFIRQQGAFQISGDSPILADAAQFLDWKPETGDEDSYLLRAVRLYQELLRFHADDDDPPAWLDANLSRLQFAAQAASGGEVTARYRSALRRFADEHAKHPLSSMALAFLARSLQADEQFVDALARAREGKARFPESVGGRMCHNTIEAILLPSVTIQTERVWNEAGPTIDVTYRNVEKVYFRLVPFDYAGWKTWGNYYDLVWSEYGEDWQRLLSKPATAEWSADLPATTDYREQTKRLPANVDAPSGCYILLTSHTADFSTGKNQISAAEVWISDLAVVMRNVAGRAELRGQVLNALSGEPVAGASVSVWRWNQDGRNSKETSLPGTSSDENGFFTVATPEQSHHKLLIEKDGQRFGLIDTSYPNSHETAPQPFERTVFFTDRAIYRPGQAIRFKAIAVAADPKENNYHTLTGRRVTVALYDVNNQEVEKRELTTNEFGSVSGSFTAPRDRATGQMYLRVTSGPGGQSAVRVEEYKRPKFYVEVDPPKEAAGLGQQVTVGGRAIGYTGAPVDGSQVTWRVVRSVQFPYWFWWRSWRMPWPNMDPTEIANGVSETDVDGGFKVEFTAEPDETIDRESEPRFSFSIYADVTDSAGETRSSSTVITVGYTSLQASLSAGSWLTSGEPVELKINVSTLDGEGQAASGTLKVYALKAPEKVHRASLQSYNWYGPGAKPAPDDPTRLASIETWPLGEVVFDKEVTTDAEGNAKVNVDLNAGAFRAVFETADPSGKPVRSELPLLVIDPAASDFAVKIPNHVSAKSWSVQPGEEFVAVWGTGYDKGRAFVELEHRGQVFKSWWTDAGSTQIAIRLPIDEKFRGGLQLRITFVRENRAYIEQHMIQVPWTNKQLTIKWEHFVSKLQPGGKETWTAIVEGPDATHATAEMVAALYDASLDAFTPHNWAGGFGVFYTDYARTQIQFYNQLSWFRSLHSGWQADWMDESWYYRSFADGIGGYGVYDFRSRRRGKSSRGGGFGGGLFPGAADELAMNGAPASASESGWADNGAGGNIEGRPATLALEAGQPVEPAAPPVDLSGVTARKNLQETAFFYPNLTVDEKGTVRIEFEIPEALTKWNFFGFAHDNDLRAALLTDEMTTSKDLMAQPNPPRFLREGDLLEFSVKLTNQSEKPQTGTARLSLADARTGESVDAGFLGTELDKPFEIPAGQSMSVFWEINVPDFTGVLTYKAVAATEKLSDGEEGFLPVLSRRILVIESLPLPIRGKQTKHFDFESLKNAANSDTLQSQSLTVQMASNPSWYAVMALPYLMEFPHECSEQVFNRLYANALGRHIVTSDPKIERIFEQWRGTEALDSPLEKNEDLRNVLIAESPWLLEAKQESQARRDVGILFDRNRLESETQRAFKRLAEMQYSDGAWPWFPGGPANDYISLYVTTGFGRMRHLGIELDVAPAIRSLDRLDNWIKEQYDWIVSHGHKDKNNLSPVICLYLYGRSFFLEDKPVDQQYREAFDYFVGQGKEFWVKLGDRQPQGHLAIALKRIGDRETPGKIMASLTERSLNEEEMGMFWREGQESWWWYRAPIETQALMIEAFDEVVNDAAKVEDCKVWLLKQKQTQNWKTTKATADAVYALLLRGTDVLASDQLVTVQLGDMEIKPEKVEAGTGFYEQRFVRGEIEPSMGDITVTKTDDGVAWGSVHWQYLEDVSKIEPYEGTPLTVKKSLYTKHNTDKGPVIKEVDGAVHVGDELVMRVEIRVDREMEYVHLKDYRGSGTEPVNVLSQYKYQDGLAYYESTKDTASHFFIDYLPRGTYVFEYSVRVQHRGRYQTGIAELQCMYAPEYNSHSGSVEIVVE